MSDTAKADSLPVVGQRVRASLIVEGKVTERDKTLGRHGGYIERISVRNDRGEEFDFLSEDTDFEILPEPMPLWQTGDVIRWTEVLPDRERLHVAAFDAGYLDRWDCVCGSAHAYLLIASLWREEGRIQILYRAPEEST